MSSQCVSAPAPPVQVVLRCLCPFTFQVRLSSCLLMARILVYGTLKKGQPNYHHLWDAANGKAEFLASALTAERYPLVITGKNNIPFLCNVPGRGHRIHGEIYEVDEKMLRFLDDFESVPTLYQRTLMEVEVKAWAEGKEVEAEVPGSPTEVFVYSTTSYEPDWLSLPNYESYDTFGDHGLEYVTREDRG